ncbi:MAG: tyrosine decarboxylase MnfA [Euryarchaeota archaeon RBG_13_31_8]|nr:MAG: tyrosine decarboxylase MnfA [Euryarchaeota archaeon RBG_13_31_8]
MNIKINENKYFKILNQLQNYKDKDFTFSSGRILGSMCTQPHPIAKKAYLEFLETNLGDPELFPGTSKIESQYLSFISNLLNAPKTATGLIGSGGSESNTTAIWISKNLSGNKEIIVPESAHFSFEKICSLMDIKLVYIPLNKDYTMNIECLKKKISRKTAAVVGLAGSSELGTIDQINELGEICNDENIFLHVDAAFGGFVIPFLKKLGYNVNDFDFKLKGVSSVSIDAHKMGYSAIPLGALVIRDKKWLDEISVETPYISIKKQAGILATRSGGPVAAAYAVAKYLGKDGYKSLVKKCIDNTFYAERKINDLGLSLVIKPTMNVLGIKIKRPEKLVNKLIDYGWRVNNMERLSAIRIVVMPHVTKKIIDDFIPDLEKACKEVGEI